MSQGAGGCGGSPPPPAAGGTMRWTALTSAIPDHVYHAKPGRLIREEDSREPAAEGDEPTLLPSQALSPRRADSGERALVRAVMEDALMVLCRRPASRAVLVAQLEADRRWLWSE